MNSAEKIALASVIIAVVSLIAFIGHSIYPPPPVAVTPAVTPTPTPTPTPTQTLTYQDSEFMEWATKTGQIIVLRAQLLLTAMESDDFEEIERYSGSLYDVAGRALNEIDQFGVSPTLKPSKDEFKLALQDYKQAGFYGEWWARNRNFYDRETSIKYMKSAVEHEMGFIVLLPQ